MAVSQDVVALNFGLQDVVVRYGLRMTKPTIANRPASGGPTLDAANCSQLSPCMIVLYVASKVLG